MIVNVVLAAVFNWLLAFLVSADRANDYTERALVTSAFWVFCLAWCLYSLFESSARASTGDYGFYGAIVGAVIIAAVTILGTKKLRSRGF